MNLVPKFLRRSESMSLAQYLSYFSYLGHAYQYGGGMSQSISSPQEEYSATFTGHAQAFMQNPVVQACMDVRASLFSEARFQYRQLVKGRPGDLFGNADLAMVEQPWPGATTGDLLDVMIQDADLAGNFYGIRQPGGIMRLRPDWVSILLAPAEGRGLGVQKVGYAYYEGGQHSGADPIALRLEEVAHFSPRRDPTAHYRGMSWMSSVIREVVADDAACEHKLKFWENGATVNLAFTFPPEVTREGFDTWVQAFKEGHEGVLNAYKTMFLGGGVDPTVIGANLEQADFKIVQGAGETRIAAAAGVPPVIAGLSEGLAAATYSNYAQSIRRFADITMRPLWRKASGALAQIVPLAAGSQLWYDDRDIPALAQDQKDLAEIQQGKASAISTLINIGFKPESAVGAVEADDFSRLDHTGLIPVQLQPKDTTMPTEKGAVDPAAAEAALAQ